MHRVYKLEALYIEERKGKGKGTITEKPQKKKKVTDVEATKFVKTSEIGEYSVVDN